MKKQHGKLTYANVVATLALFIAIGGATAFAATQLAKNSVGTKQLKNNAVTTAKIKNGAVTGTKVKSSSLGTVPSATNAENAGKLGGVAAPGYAKSQPEAVHLVGASGEPALEHGCVNFNPPESQQAGFYKDPFGIVHLLGDVNGCTAGTSMFVLPAGFRPTSIQRFVVRGATDTTDGTVRVAPSGEVVLFGTKEAAINGVTFRTD
jgi:hypothetical protein